MEKKLKQDKYSIMEHCDAIENLGYTKILPEDELAMVKDELARLSIHLAEIEEVKRAGNKEWDKQIKELKGVISNAIERLKTKSEYVTEECYKFIDNEAQEVGYYNGEGDLVWERPARTDELQQTIFQIGRTGTNN